MLIVNTIYVNNTINVNMHRTIFENCFRINKTFENRSVSHIYVELK